jgi:hypothetical protein
MKTRMFCLIVLFVPAVLLFSGCGGVDNKSFIPVTSVDEITVPAAVEQIRENVLKVVGASSRLATDPSVLEWQLADEEFNGEYRYTSGDWLMVIWPEQDGRENHRIVIMNKTDNAYWCGYVTPDSEVVDTSFMP